MRIQFFLMLFLVALGECFGDRFIHSTKYEDQEEVFVDGGSVIVSNKTNSVFMYQTSERMSDRGNFYFSISNETHSPINFCFSDLKVTDQWGRDIKVVHKKELIAAKKSAHNWQTFASLLCLGIESANAQNAGKIHYQSHTTDNYRANFNAYGSNQSWVHGSVYGSGSSTTTGTVHCEALRQQAIRRVQDDAGRRQEQIQAHYHDWEYRLNNFYFDSNTIFPKTSYSVNFQIVLDKEVEKDLQYLLFTYQVGGEEHTFSYYCGDKVKTGCFGF